MDASLTSRRAYFISLISLIITVAILWLYAQGARKELVAEDLFKLPLEINGWVGEEIQVPDRSKRILGTENIILRCYRKDLLPVNLYILECASNRASFHPPEYCYVGGKTEMIERGSRTIRWEGGAVHAHRFLFLGPRGRNLVYYWYTFGAKILSSYYLQQIDVVLSNIMGNPQPALLIRVSIDGSFSLESADRVITEFAADIMPAIIEYINYSK